MTEMRTLAAIDTQDAAVKALHRLEQGVDPGVVLCDFGIECFLRGHEQRPQRWDEETTPIVHTHERKDGGAR